MAHLDDFLGGPAQRGLVSVILPTYNRARILRASLDSILAQTYGHLEAIVVDDGSTDDTRSVVAAYSDSRVRYFHQANGGLSSARNSGFRQARGEFIAFLDSDDIWLPWKLALQVEILRRHPEVGLVWSDMSSFTNDGEVIEERFLRKYYSAFDQLDMKSIFVRSGTLGERSKDTPVSLSGCPYYLGDIFRSMFKGNLVHPPTAMVTRERVLKAGPFQPEVTGRGAEDYHFFWRIAEHGPVAFVDAPTMLYRVGDPQQMTGAHNLIHEARGNLRVVMHWLHRFAPTLPRSEIRERLASSHAWLGSEELNAGNRRAAIRHFWQSLRLRPQQVFVMVMLFVALLPPAAVPMLGAAKRTLLAGGPAAVLVKLAILSSGLFFLIHLLGTALHSRLTEP